MAFIQNLDEYLQRRDDYYYSNSNNGRYAFFAFFIAIIVIFLLFTCYVNVKRMKNGGTPIISHYLSPPSYFQSQARDANTTAPTVEPLPQYTENPNPNQDAGYYDQNGNFIPYNKLQNLNYTPQTQQQPYNPNLQQPYQPGPPASSNPFMMTGESVPGPSQAYYGTSTTIDTSIYAPPPGAPPAPTSNLPSPSGAVGTTNYVAPPGPPPAAHSKN
ncbi:unnamed protein product [Ambrosiozyma monospora]|uniref:Unnamed protein product n=1 Tax=Ambrosiozyma monospora TaxID=43982 RepID=A0A9W7DEG9_AMBMO|nr:unnamed protein product [Ambrosiozyma monospora]